MGNTGDASQGGEFTGRMSLKEEMCGDGEGESSPAAFLAPAAIGLGSEAASEVPRLPGLMNLETSCADPSFSHR